MSINLNKITERYQEAKRFLDYMMSRNIRLTNGDITKPTQQGYYWDLACYYSRIKIVSNDSSDRILNVIKPRQCGITTFNAAYATFKASEGNNVLFVGLSNAAADDFINICDLSGEACSKPNSKELCFPFWDGRPEGKIIAKIQNNLDLHDEPKDLIIIDELAHFKNRNIEDVCYSVFPLARYFGQIISASTPGEVTFTDICNRYGYYQVSNSGTL